MREMVVGKSSGGGAGGDVGTGPPAASVAAGEDTEMTGLTEHLRRHTQRHIHIRPGNCHQGLHASGISGNTSPTKSLLVARQRHAKIDRFFLVLFPLI